MRIFSNRIINLLQVVTVISNLKARIQTAGKEAASNAKMRQVQEQADEAQQKKNASNDLKEGFKLAFIQ